ncbi:MAG: bifunctional phosphoglucose/phosphomannose isomerase [Caldithrix sp.]|nr:bifunctional phosphoglucose/phosphomannose isomerase [Caldithrix sp.]
MYSVDKFGYKNILLNFHEQIKESKSIYDSAQIKLDQKRIKNILYVGMGGSAIVGNILYDVLFDQIKIPMDVVRGYFVPHYCNENTMVIASSYSGNTEETINALQQAHDKGAQIVVTSSGGQLKNIAEAKHWQRLIIPSGLAPRLAIGYLFFTVYHVLGKFNLIEGYNEHLTDLIRFVQNTAKRNDYMQTEGHVLSKELAHVIHGNIPVIYSTAPYLKTVSYRWQNQFQEMGKSMAFANVLPEINHNEIMGWEHNIDVLDRFIVIFLENETPHPKIKKRIELSKEIIKRRGVRVVDIYTDGKNTMEKIFSAIMLGDWVSYYLALAYKKDPNEISHINFVKQELAKLNN